MINRWTRQKHNICHQYTCPFYGILHSIFFLIVYLKKHFFFRFTLVNQYNFVLKCVFCRFFYLLSIKVRVFKCNILQKHRFYKSSELFQKTDFVLFLLRYWVKEIHTIHMRHDPSGFGRPATLFNHPPIRRAKWARQVHSKYFFKPVISLK